jgi:hypothetical protein
MLKLPKNLVKLLTILLLTSSCNQVPPKPSVELCILDVANMSALCGNTSAVGITTSEEATYNRLYSLVKTAQNATKQPLMYVEHGVALKPMQWGILQNYIHELELAAKTKCSQ